MVIKHNLFLSKLEEQLVISSKQTDFSGSTTLFDCHCARKHPIQALGGHLLLPHNFLLFLLKLESYLLPHSSLLRSSSQMCQVHKGFSSKNPPRKLFSGRIQPTLLSSFTESLPKHALVIMTSAQKGPLKASCLQAFCSTLATI